MFNPILAKLRGETSHGRHGFSFRSFFDKKKVAEGKIA